MEIFKKIGTTPTCRKETIERKEKLGNRVNLEQKILERKIKEAKNGLRNPQSEKPCQTLEEDTGDPQAENPVQQPETREEGQAPESGNKETSEVETKDLIFSSNVSYPSLSNVTPNKGDVRNLKALAFGRGGELSTILTYIYQFYTLPNSEKNLKAALKEALGNEMTHYEILNDAIVSFGGNPTLTDGQGNVWTGRNVNQENNPKKILLDNISLEQGLIKQYLAAAREASNLSLAELFLKIIEEKQKDIELFQQIYNSLE